LPRPRPSRRPGRISRHVRCERRWVAALWRLFCAICSTGMPCKAPRPVQAPALPSGLQRALADCIAAEVATARAALTQELESAVQAQKDLISENEGLLAEVAGLQQTLEELNAQHSQLEGRYAQLQQEVVELKQLAEAHRGRGGRPRGPRSRRSSCDLSGPQRLKKSSPGYGRLWIGSAKPVRGPSRPRR